MHLAKEYQKGMDTNMILMVDITESKIIINAPSTDSFQSVSLTRSEERKKKSSISSELLYGTPEGIGNEVMD